MGARCRKFQKKTLLIFPPAQLMVFFSFFGSGGLINGAVSRWILPVPLHKTPGRFCGLNFAILRVYANCKYNCGWLFLLIPKEEHLPFLICLSLLLLNYFIIALNQQQEKSEDRKRLPESDFLFIFIF